MGFSDSGPDVMDVDWLVGSSNRVIAGREGRKADAPKPRVSFCGRKRCVRMGLVA